MAYIYIMEYYSTIKNDKIMAFAGKWMKLENIMLSEVSQSQKTQRTNDLADKRMMTHNVGWEGRGEVKNNRMCQTSLLYVNV